MHTSGRKSLLLIIIHFGILYSVWGSRNYPSRFSRASSVWGACPRQCRCMDLNQRGTRGILEGWRALDQWVDKSASSYGRERRDESKNNGRSMVCQGLRRLPKPIPTDVTKMTVYGDSSGHFPEPSIAPSGQASEGGQSDRLPLISDTQLRYITRDSFQGNIRMTELTLSGNNIGILYPNIFHPLRTLRLLALSNNNIRHLSAAAFNGMNNVRELRLSDNMIRYLPHTIFSYLPNLRTLRLNGNKLRRLPRNVFAPLTNVVMLDLSRNNFTDFYDDVFDNNTHLEELLLNGNRLWMIRARWFQNLVSLRSLSLRGNAITRVNADSFANLFNLEELLLSANHIDVIQPGAFTGLRELKVLDLATNDIPIIPKDIFVDLDSLKELFLATNKIQSVTNETFYRIQTLSRLDLSRNQIESIASGSFRSLTNLQYLEMSHNKLQRVEPLFIYGLIELKEISMDHNFIKVLPDNSFQTTADSQQSKLAVLSLQNNALKEIKAESLQGTPHLKSLNLAHNRIKRIHSLGLSNFVNLRSLKLNNNRIRNLNNRVFSNLRQVFEIDLSSNKLRHISQTMFNGMTNIEDINLSANSIKSISSLAFRRMDALVELKLKNNKLMGFNFSHVTNLPKLTAVDLSNNHLFWVDLSGNIQLRLRELLLNDNNINTVTRDITKVMASSSIVGMTGNPLLCDCKLKWILDSAITRKIRLDMENEMICKLPNRLHGRKAAELRPEEMTCNADLLQNGRPSFLCDDSHFRMRSLYNTRRGERSIIKRHVTVFDSLRGDTIGNGVMLDDNWILVSGEVVPDGGGFISSLSGVKVKIGRKKGTRKVLHAIRHPLTTWRQYNVALLRLEGTNTTSRKQSPCLMTEKQFKMIYKIYPKITLTTRVGVGRHKLKPRHGRVEEKCRFNDYLCVKIKGRKSVVSEYMMLGGSPLFLGNPSDMNLAGLGSGRWTYVSNNSETLFVPMWNISEWIDDVIREYDSKCRSDTKKTSVQCTRTLHLPTAADILTKIRRPEYH